MNKVIIMGRLTDHPKLKTSANGTKTSSFTVAVQRDFLNSAGERETDFFDVVAFRNTAEFITRYFLKGNMIAISGKLQTRSYTDKNGNNRKANEIIADSAYFTGEKNKTPSEDTYKCDGEAIDDEAVNVEVIDEDLPF